MSLIHLIYVSSATQLCDVDELERILESSARRNSTQQVTGMLVYVGGNFMQVLEGEEAAIDETYGRIAQDARHRDLIVIDRGRIVQREFERWSMGFRRLGTEEIASHPGYAPFFDSDYDVKAIGARPGLALDLLKEFGSNQSR
jgi:hypothetical protein